MDLDARLRQAVRERRAGELLCAEVLDVVGYLRFRHPVALELGNKAAKLAEPG
jgi:hypothetical protein